VRPHCTSRSTAGAPDCPRLVVIGNGMVGVRLLEDLLARAPDRYAITVFGAEPVPAYNRIALSEVLSGSRDAGEIALQPAAWYAQHGIDLRVGVTVTAIDRAARLISTADGSAVPYDVLVLATGSRPFVPPLPGCEKEGVFVFRTLDDCAAITSYAQRCRTATVLGGGLLGLEAARGLLSHGLAVTVVEAAPHLMCQQLDAESGAILRQVMEGLGLRVVTAATTAAVLGNGRVTGLALHEGDDLDADMVVVSCGIRPNVDLARQAGLTVERGIVVDDHLRTEDPAIFAVGECAQHRGTVYGLVAPLYEQTRVLASVLASDTAACYTGSRPTTTLKVMGVDLVSLGRLADASPGDEIVTYSEPARGVYQKLVLRDSVLVAGCLLGATATAPSVLRLYDTGQPAPARRADLLFGPATAAASDVSTLPDDTPICQCHQVSKGMLTEQIGRGKTTIRALSACTKAGTGCGGCRPLLQDLIAAYAGDVAGDPSVHWYVPGIPMTKPELVAAIRERGLRSVSAVFRELAAGKDDAASKPGLASLLRTIWHEEYDDERDARFINDRVHANIQHDGTFSVVPRIYGGITSPEQLRRIADVAEQYRVPMVKITGGQRIDLLGVRRDDLPAVWRDLGMPSGHAYTKAFRTCKTCVGTDFCRYGVGDSTGLGLKIERRFQGIETPHKVKMAVSGCGRNCAEATVKDVGVVAVEGGWEVYVGGAAGSRVRAADLLARVGTHEEALVLIGRFLQYYREHAKYMERSPAFVERMGIERLRRVLVDDVEGIVARLDAEMQAAVDSYRDPWQEANEPVHPAQFAAPPVLSAAASHGDRGGARVMPAEAAV
jgi:nitrite reductase (NADH) large subunit